MSNQVFISYAREDEKFVLTLASGLRQIGLRPWVAQLDIAGGMDWDRTIDAELAKSDKVLVILSPAAVNSTQVRSEINLATDHKKDIVPILYKRCSEIPRVLRLFQYVDFSGDVNHSIAMERLASALGAAVPAEPPALVPPPPPPVWRRRALIGTVTLIPAGAIGITVIGRIIHRSPVPVPDGEPTGAGKLQVNVNADSVRVSLDGSPLGRASRMAPLVATGIVAGQHVVEAELDGQDAQQRRVYIADGENGVSVTFYFH